MKNHAIEIHCRANTILCFIEIRKKNSDEQYCSVKNYPIEIHGWANSCDRAIRHKTIDQVHTFQTTILSIVTSTIVRKLLKVVKSFNLI